MPNDGQKSKPYDRRAILRSCASVAGVGVISGCGAFNNNPYDGADIENVFIKVTEGGAAKFVAIFDTTVPPEPETQQTAFKTGTPDQLTEWRDVSFEMTNIQQVDKSIERTKYDPVAESKFPIQNTITGRYTGIRDNIPNWPGDHSWYQLPAIEFIESIGRHTGSSSEFAKENITFVIEYPTGVQQRLPLRYNKAKVVNNAVAVSPPGRTETFDSGDIFSSYDLSGMGLPFRSGSASPSSQTVMVGSTFNDNLHLARVVSASETKFSAQFAVKRCLNFDIQKESAIKEVNNIFAETFQELTVKLLLSTVSSGAPPSGGAAVRGGDLFSQSTDLFEEQISLGEQANRALDQSLKAFDKSSLPWYQEIEVDSDPPNIKTIVDLISVEDDFATLLPNSITLSRFETLIGGFIELLDTEITLAEELLDIIRDNKVTLTEGSDQAHELVEDFLERIKNISETQREELAKISVPDSVGTQTPATGAETDTPAQPQVTRVGSIAPPAGGAFGNRIGLHQDTAVIGEVSDAPVRLFRKRDSTWEEVDQPADDFDSTGVALCSNTVLIGEWPGSFEDQSGINIYEISRDGWNYQTNILPESTEVSGDQFGIEISRDDQTVYILDPQPENGAGIHVYSRQQGRWAKQRSPITDPYRMFSIDAGGGNLIIGTGGQLAYIYEQARNESAEERQSVLNYESAVESDVGLSGFGTAVAIDGDTAIVGAPDVGEDGSVTGAAYVFTRTQGEWNKEKTLQPDDLPKDGRFGAEITLENNIAVIAAPGPGPTGRIVEETPGEAYVYSGEDNAWSQPVRLDPDRVTDDNAHFGGELALDGDTLLIGAPGDSSFDATATGGGYGAVYEYQIDSV